jgi:negative regulator of sigma E activity
MEHADGELEDPELAAQIERDPDARTRFEAIHEIGELMRGHLELSADAVHDARFAAMWRRIDGELVAPASGLWARLSGWFDRYRGHVITGAVSAGAVAALALILRPGNTEIGAAGGHAIELRPVAQRATPEIDSLDTPGGSSTVISLNDDDGNAAVIWVTPDDDTEAL